MTIEEENNEVDKKQLIIELYADIVKEKQRLPTYNDYMEHDISRSSIRHSFGNIENLHSYIEHELPDYVDNHIATQKKLFLEEQDIMDRLDVGRYRRFIITTAVADSKPHEGFLQAMDNYAADKNAKICIMPAESITNSFENEKGSFAPVFNEKKYIFITDNISLNDNLFLCSIQVSAKQIKPITGLSRLGKRDGSYIFASPKQFLEMLPSGNQRNHSYAIMTPGSCTYPNYYSDVFVSKRLAYIADKDHTIGGIIVEVEDDRHFHFRHFQCAPDGSFTDLGVQYNPDGTTEKVGTVAVMGDLHVGDHDEDCVEQFLDVARDCNIESYVIHDVFNGHSINHHIENNIVSKAKRSRRGRSSLAEELLEGADYLYDMGINGKEKPIYIVKSNHDEWLDRYLSEGRYINDPENHYDALMIAPSLFDERDVLQTGYLHAIDHNYASDIYQEMSSFLEHRVVFLRRDEDLMYGDVQLGVHGDLGLNGARGSLNTYEKVYGRCVIGHNHGAAIQRQVFRVGTFTKLELGYNVGPSSWSQTGALVYENGQVQLLNFINGKFHIEQDEITEEIPY